MKTKANKLASEIVGSHLASALRHSPGYMVGALAQTRIGMMKDGTLHVKSYVSAFLGSIRIDDQMAKQFPTWRQVV